MTEEAEYKRAKVLAFKRLAAKSQHSIELRKALQKQEIAAEIITRLIGECQRLGYLNDREWIEGFIKGQLARHKGPKQIAMKLRLKGIPSDEFAEFLQDNLSNQQESIQNLLRTKYQRYDLKDYRQKQKAIASLFRRGFDLEAILHEIALMDKR